MTDVSQRKNKRRILQFGDWRKLLRTIGRRNTVPTIDAEAETRMPRIVNKNASAKHDACSGKVRSKAGGKVMPAMVQLPVSQTSPATSPATPSVETPANVLPTIELSPPEDGVEKANDADADRDSTVTFATIELAHHSRILTDESLKLLSLQIPARVQGYMWSLQYSTEKHGFSLSTMYRRQTEKNRFTKPTILVLADTDDRMFGFFCSEQLLASEHFIGTGECFIFSLSPEFRVYNWSGENNYFVKCSAESIVVGSGSGRSALWLDSELFHGQTQNCETFNNQPLTGDGTEDFVVKLLEVWSIKDEDDD